MAIFRKTVRVGIVVTFLSVNLAFTSCEEIPGGSSLGLGGETAVQMCGDLVYPGCSPEEVREARSRDKTPSQLTHGRDRLVSQVA